MIRTFLRYRLIEALVHLVTENHSDGPGEVVRKGEPCDGLLSHEDALAYLGYPIAGRLAQRGAGWHGEAEQTAKTLVGGLRDFNGETHG